MIKHLTFDDVSIVPKYSEVISRKDTIIVTKIFDKYINIPIISANMESVTDYKMCKSMSELGGIGCLHRFMSIEENIRQAKLLIDSSIYFIATIGLEYNRFESLYNIGIRNFCIDMAHGHCISMKRMIEHIRNKPEYCSILAGNIATKEAALDLYKWGADLVKVGIGPGAACITREQTGIGVPQLSALLNVAESHVPFIADGGCRKPGDVAKALATGAKAVMLGSMLAGCDESAAEIDPKDKTRKIYKGSASVNNETYKTEEGVQISIPRTGPLKNILNNIAGGVRSSLSYVGAFNLSQYKTNAQFIEVTSNGYLEGTPHGKNL